ncbi:MAG: response regulator, partial [Candidatus Omnitrophica bacterium]|nr:response regulator [Candidatus Omnitrophota bacterium]
MEEKKAKILVVDDEPAIISILQDFLSRKGYEVAGALSGEEALSILRKETIDLLILDILMPGIKGTDVAKAVKTMYPHTKAIIITGYPKEGEELQKKKIIENLFIKPFKLADLCKDIEMILKNRIRQEQTHDEL